MPFNLLLLPLMGGYVFVSRWNRTRFETKRHTGERLLFSAAIAGVFFLIVAFIIVRLLATWQPELRAEWAQHVPFPHAGTSLLAFLLGCVTWWPANLFFPEAAEQRRAIQGWGDHLEILFDRAISGSEYRLVSMTLKGGKVYIGLVIRNFDPAYDRKYVTILPVVSGYRDTSTHEVHLTTWYDAVYQEVIENRRADLRIEDFEVVIPVGELLTANLFDWDAYDEFQRLTKQRGDEQQITPPPPAPSD